MFEVKNISKKPSVNSVIKLLEQSCNNRQAHIGVYVASTKETAPVQTAFSRIAPNMYSVVVNKDNLDTLALEVCYQVAKLEALSKLQKISNTENIDFEKILQNLKNLTMLTEIVSQIRANVSKAETDLVDAHGNINNLESQLKNPFHQ